MFRSPLCKYLFCLVFFYTCFYFYTIILISIPCGIINETVMYWNSLGTAKYHNIFVTLYVFYHLFLCETRSDLEEDFFSITYSVSSVWIVIFSEVFKKWMTPAVPLCKSFLSHNIYLKFIKKWQCLDHGFLNVNDIGISLVLHVMQKHEILMPISFTHLVWIQMARPQRLDSD